MTRGERNHNPGNIERVPGTVWKGQAADQSGDPRFVVFASDVWGVRALVRVMLTYSRAGVDTVREIVSRWAPSSENNTEAYIHAVAKDMDVSSHDEIDVTDPVVMTALVRAIIKHENGRVSVSDADIANGVERGLA